MKLCWSWRTEFRDFSQISGFWLRALGLGFFGGFRDVGFTSTLLGLDLLPWGLALCCFGDLRGASSAIRDA